MSVYECALLSICFRPKIQNSYDFGDAIVFYLTSSLRGTSFTNGLFVTFLFVYIYAII